MPQIYGVEKTVARLLDQPGVALLARLALTSAFWLSGLSKALDFSSATDEVRALLKATGFPGMKVLQFAFGGGADNPYLPHNYHDPNYVVYTGTHDNDTTLGWFGGLSDAERAYVARYVGTDGMAITTDLIRLALSSTARTAIIPLQDVLDLGSEARVNTPGAAQGNWAWRVRADQLDPARAECLAELTALYGRA